MPETTSTEQERADLQVMALCQALDRAKREALALAERIDAERQTILEASTTELRQMAQD